MPSRHLNMFNLRLCNAAIIRYSQLKFGHMHLCGIDYKYFSPHCCKCNSFGCTAAAAIRCDNACHGPHSDSLYSGSEQCQFNSPRLVKREAGFPNPRRALIGSNQLWRVNDSAYFREFWFVHYPVGNRVLVFVFVVYPDGRVCISILHAPGDDPMGYESSAERWSPVQSVEKILLSVVSMLAGVYFMISIPGC